MHIFGFLNLKIFLKKFPKTVDIPRNAWYYIVSEGNQRQDKERMIKMTKFYDHNSILARNHDGKLVTE